MIFKLRTSKDTMEYFSEMNASLRLQPFVLCKLAIACSLHSPKEQSVNFGSDSEGLELNRQTITGEYDDLFRALVTQYEDRQITDDEFFPKLIKYHIDRGASLLHSEYRYAGSNFYHHLLELEKSI